MTKEEAINIVKYYRDLPIREDDKKALERAIKALEQEPKTGHWIDHQEDRWIYAKCSECGTVHDSRTKYCPNCGAEMESEE